MSSNHHILIVDDEPDIRNLISDILIDEGYSVTTAANGKEASQQLSSIQPHLILLDIWMPDIDGISLMKDWLGNKKTSAPIVMMSGHGTVETAVEATRLGAKDFIEKPLSLAKLLQTVSETIEKFSTTEEETKNIVDNSFEPIGTSKIVAELKENLSQAIPSNKNIMLLGEDGVGKFTLSKYIHFQRNAPPTTCIYLDSSKVNDLDVEKKLCAPESGLFNQAKDGHLVLTNIEHSSKKFQSFLKTVLKTKTFQNGSDQNPVDFKIISIAKAIDVLELNSVDSELLGLLTEIKISIPSLEERSEDIPEIVNFFVNTLPDEENTPYRKLSFAVQNRLRNQHWTNNLTELKNTVRQLLINGKSGEVELEEIEEVLKTNQEAKASNEGLLANWYQQPLRDAREEFEKAYLIHHLKSVDGRVGELAKVAGMERTHLYRKLRALDINPKNINQSS